MTVCIMCRSRIADHEDLGIMGDVQLWRDFDPAKAIGSGAQPFRGR